MSISVYGRIPTGAGEFAEAFDAGNYTGNCAPMWRAAISGTFDSPPRGLKDLEGFQCAACVLILQAAILHMDDPANRDRYLMMNPGTGFGDFESAREWLRNILDLCRKHPLAFLHVIS
jgi:hypothetical protein